MNKISLAKKEKVNSTFQAMILLLLHIKKISFANKEKVNSTFLVNLIKQVKEYTNLYSTAVEYCW